MGNLRAFQRDPLGFMASVARQYGDMATYRMLTLHFYQLSHPDLVEQVLVKNAKQFRKSSAIRRSKPLLGEGLLTSEGDFWLRQRRLAAPAFHRDRIIAYGEAMVHYAAKVSDEWRDGEERDIMIEMSRITMSIVTRTLFGQEMESGEAEISHNVEQVLREWIALTYRMPFTDSWPLPGNLRFWRGIRELDRVIMKLIRQRREAEGAGPLHVDATQDGAMQARVRGDLLSMLLQAQDEDGSRMTDKQLRDEVMTLFGAGHETTAVALTWSLYLLAQHPEIEERIQAEVDQVLGDRHPTVDDLPGLRFTEQVVLETMRLYPPAWITGREALTEVEIGGVRIPQGSTVVMPQWVIHRDPRFFRDPERFDPDRWADGLEKRIPTFAYFPFGGGPRICIGKQFAQMEAVLVLATIARRFRMRPVQKGAVELEPLITLRPKHGMPMRIERRSEG